MMDGVKGERYDAMDIIQSIKSGPAGDTSMGIRDMLIVLWSKVDKRFRSYLRGKKRRWLYLYKYKETNMAKLKDLLKENSWRVGYVWSNRRSGKRKNCSWKAW